ncbi:MAG: hypothetical protein HQL64_02340 [Magnetococcales bacterium]|nr:hypothetical protein [Magnetococcales bacterium]
MSKKYRMLLLGVVVFTGLLPWLAAASQDLPTDEELLKACQELAMENAIPAAEKPGYLTQCVQDLQNSLQMEEADGIDEPIGMPPYFTPGSSPSTTR